MQAGHDNLGSRSLSMNRGRKAGVNPRTLPQARDFAITPAHPFRAQSRACGRVRRFTGAFRFMTREQVRKEQVALQEPRPTAPEL